MADLNDNEDPLVLKEYVLTLMTESKKLDKEIAAIQDEIRLWAGRVKLAADSGRTDLQSQAEIRLGEIKQKLDRRMNEKSSLEGEVKTLKRKLLYLKNKPEMSVDADLLLAQFEMLLGEKAEEDELEKKFDKFEADSMLDDLKKKMDE